MFLPQSNGEVLAQSPAGATSSKLVAGLLASVDGWNFPLALLRPLEPLFTGKRPVKNESYLTGLRAENFLGAGVLPVKGKRAMPLAWVGVELGHGAANTFAEVRGGCWVPGYPSIGRGRNLLRAAGVPDSAGLGALLKEIGFADTPGSTIYFNFQHDQSQLECERVYVLDSVAHRLLGFALPGSALARNRMKD
jgi:hypothetical protein